MIRTGPNLDIVSARLFRLPSPVIPPDDPMAAPSCARDPRPVARAAAPRTATHPPSGGEGRALDGRSAGTAGRLPDVRVAQRAGEESAARRPRRRGRDLS